MKKRILIIVAISSLFLSSCVKIGEYYAGLNLQPNMDNSKFSPGLNVYGILKTGPNLDTINHYFEVQQLLNIADWSDSISLNDASIQLRRITKDWEQQHYAPAVVDTNGRYFDETIITAPGDRWTYVCVYDTFEVTASCTIPNTPEIVEGSLLKEENRIRFSIKSDETAFMYFVYLINGENALIEQTVPVAGSNTVFDLQPDWEIGEGGSLLYIFAYDQNLEAYNTTSNTFFKPNAYRPLFSTVEGGYGTFGATSSCLVTF